MRMRLSLLATLLLFFANLPLLLAHETTTKTFTTDDQSFSFDYPADWTVEIINADQGPNAHLSVDNLPLHQRFELPDGLNLQISLPTQFFPDSSSTIATPKEIVMNAIGVLQPVSIDFATRQPNQTPQPLELQSASPDVGEFEVDGRPAAYGYNTTKLMGIESSLMLIVADLEGGYRVSINATSFKGGLNTLQKYEPQIIALVQSMRFTPPVAVFSGDPALPQVYSGLVGLWQRGYITFYYPEGWYVPNTGTLGGLVFITNSPDKLANTTPQSGQFTARLDGVSETRASAEPGELFNQCDISKSDLTARKLVEKLLGNLTPALLGQIKNAGITMTQPEVTTANGKEIVYLRQYQNDVEVLTMFIDLGDGNIPSMTVTTKKGEMAQFEDQLFAVAGTFQYEAKPCDATPTGS